MYQTKYKKLSKPRLRACKLPLAVLLGLFLSLLVGCSSTKPVVYKRELPPQELLAECPYVREELTTNGGLARTILAYRASISTCNTDKASLREWAAE